MEIEEIVIGICKDVRIVELVSKMQPENLQSDLLSHCKVYLYTHSKKYPGKIEAMHENKTLFAWFSTVIKREMTGANSKFYRAYRREKTIFADVPEARLIEKPQSGGIEFASPSVTLTPEQKTALNFIYKRIEQKKGTNAKKKEGTGQTIYKIQRIEKKLENIREIKTVIEAFSMYLEYCMDYVLKYYRGHARFVYRNKGKDPDAVLADLNRELNEAIQEKERLTQNLNTHQQRIVQRMERKLTQTKAERRKKN